jgi:catechol 2,3-dioxygenase-like lactoylglutathione lyase family enzyme
MLNIHYLHHVAIAITDLERAKAFYGGVLELTELPIRGIDSNRAWYQAGPCQVNLIVQKKADPKSPRHVALCVDSIRQARKALEEKGIELTKTTQVSNINRFFFEDPDGNRLEIVCPIGQG